MAGILKVDQVQSDSNLAFAIAGSNVAFMNATSLQVVGSNISVAGTNVITNGKVVASAQPIGAVLQVVNTTYTSTFSQSVTTSRVKLNNISVSITPTSASSKILIMCSVFFEATNPDHNFPWFLYRDSTDLAAPTAGSRISSIAMAGSGYFDSDNDSTAATVMFQYFDSPATTSTITYAPGVYCSTASQTVYINRTVADLDSNGYERGISSITLMEIAA